MIPLEDFRKLEPEFATMTDEELIKIRADLYQAAGLAIECFMKEKTGSKNLDRVIAITKPTVTNLSHE